MLHDPTCVLFLSSLPLAIARTRGIMSPLQFQPFSSQPSPEFWSALTTLKLDKLRLDDTSLPVHAWVDEGREIVNTNKLTGHVEGNPVGVDGSVLLGAGAFDAAEEG